MNLSPAEASRAHPTRPELPRFCFTFSCSFPCMPSRGSRGCGFTIRSCFRYQARNEGSFPAKRPGSMRYLERRSSTRKSEEELRSCTGQESPIPIQRRNWFSLLPWRSARLTPPRATTTGPWKASWKTRGKIGENHDADLAIVTPAHIRRKRHYAALKAD